MSYRYKACDVFCLSISVSMSVCFNSDNFNTVCLGNSIVLHEQLVVSPVHDFLIQCCLVAIAIVAPSVMRWCHNTPTCILLPICHVSGFHLGAEKNYIYEIFSTMKTSNHFEQGTDGG